MDLFDPNALSDVNRDPQLWETARTWWPFCLLRDLAAKGNAEGYKRCLTVILMELDAKPPDGVFRPFRWPRGRPTETQEGYALGVLRGNLI